MSPAAILNRVRALGCDLIPAEDDKLRLIGPQKARAELAELVRTNKAALLAYLPRPRPEPLAVVDHCVRVRPDTAATGNERQVLAQVCKALTDDGEVDALLLNLFGYWRQEAAPNLAAFLGQTTVRGAA